MLLIKVHCYFRIHTEKLTISFGNQVYKFRALILLFTCDQKLEHRPCGYNNRHYSSWFMLYNSKCSTHSFDKIIISRERYWQEYQSLLVYARLCTQTSACIIFRLQYTNNTFLYCTVIYIAIFKYSRSYTDSLDIIWNHSNHQHMHLSTSVPSSVPCIHFSYIKPN